MSETSAFTEDILKAAHSKAQSIITEAESEAQRATDEAKAGISREAADIVRNAQGEADSIKRRQTSEARHLSKLREQREKNAILSEVLDLAKKRVLEATKNERQYLLYLAAQVEDGVRELGSDTAVVHLNGADLKRINRADVEREVAKRIGRSVRVEWATEPIEAIGGVVVSSADTKTRIVNTLDQKFDALEPTLLIEAGKSLFGE
ncbi:MAG TPA: V-type ATP synthase subunit E family protein [Terriglobales bacterium]|nr:V-type ATP synthase subunit E family protein [Terriglobales bacterium]